ncbi:MAG: metal ABC transporter substrate-binding protein [Oscillospiraceae bacterium]|nr:metal ABC transporter substrate-binding protein [Oscillospiraceae bacterium]
MKLRKITAILVATFMLLAVATACNGESESNDNIQNTENRNTESQDETPDLTATEKIKIVSTTFPQYDWTREIIGDKADDFELTLLINSAVDLHSYDPSISDIAKISDCDLFIYVGGESDEWVKNALDNADNPDMVAINLVEELGDAVKTERITEGMEHEDDHDDHDEEDDHDDEDDHDHEDEEDEHVWLSLRNAQLFCEVIADAISSLDPENADAYDANMTAYIKRLDDLDKEYQDMADSATVKTLLFADRFPFLYLADDYGIDFYAAFSGCSAETEASPSTIATLTEKLNELGLKFVMVTESANQKIAETIIGNTESKDQTILVLDAIQSVTVKDIENGATYLSIMESNLEVLTAALEVEFEPVLA